MSKADINTPEDGYMKWRWRGVKTRTVFQSASDDDE